jgi:two-component system, NarL family, response regulator NreC
MPITVFLADDHQILRAGVHELLERDGFQIVGEAADGHVVLESVASLNPEIAVLDLAMPLLNGIDAARELGVVSPRTRIILLTRFADSMYVLSALRAGVRGYVLKTEAVADLCRAIREVAAGRIYLSPGVSAAVVDRCLSWADADVDPLTRRQRQVLQLVAEGRTTKEIGGLLGVSAKTAESHRVALMAKLDLHDTASVVRYAIRHGLVQP